MAQVVSRLRPEIGQSYPGITPAILLCSRTLLQSLLTPFSGRAHRAVSYSHPNYLISTEQLADRLETEPRRLRIFDVTDVPHPKHDLVEYLWHGSLCRASGGSQAGCLWRAPEVGQWMNFSDLNEDGEPDASWSSNVNGGRASYIHYAEPFDKMVDASHLGYPSIHSGKLTS